MTETFLEDLDVYINTVHLFEESYILKVTFTDPSF